MVILHIYGDRPIFLLFYDDQDTETEEWEMQMSTSQLIFTHKNTPKAPWKTYNNTLQNGRKTGKILHTYGDRGIFLLFYDDQDTGSEYCEIQMSIYQLISTHKNISKYLWYNDNNNIPNGRK